MLSNYIVTVMSGGGGLNPVPTSITTPHKFCLNIFNNVCPQTGAQTVVTPDYRPSVFAFTK